MNILLVFICVFSTTVSANGTHRNYKEYRLSVSGPKSVPIGGFLLKGMGVGGSDSGSLQKMEKTVLSSINGLNKVLKGVSNKINSIDERLKGVSKTVKILVDRNHDDYIGCYKDDGERHMKYNVNDMRNQLTLEKCRNHCKGYRYAALQFRSVCFCGNTLTNSKYPKVAESDCNMSCSGEHSRMCGGAYRNSIYKV